MKGNTTQPVLSSHKRSMLLQKTTQSHYGAPKLMFQLSKHKSPWVMSQHHHKGVSGKKSMGLACSAGDGGNDLYLSIGGGDKIKLPKKRAGMHPNAELTQDEVVELQLKVNAW